MKRESTLQVLAVALVVVVLMLSACAALPVPLSPQNEQHNSDMAEGAWLVLDGIDTYQTMRFDGKCRETDPIAAHLYGSDYPKPGRVLATNLVLALGHTMVTSWLDDEVAKHEMLNDDSVGPWYVGRIVWHVVSIVGTGAAVINNKHLGCG
jgi:hypothetical protein